LGPIRFPVSAPNRHEASARALNQVEHGRVAPAQGFAGIELDAADRSVVDRVGVFTCVLAGHDDFVVEGYGIPVPG
jgi:hypothetical protein